MPSQTLLQGEFKSPAERAGGTQSRMEPQLEEDHSDAFSFITKSTGVGAQDAL